MAYNDRDTNSDWYSLMGVTNRSLAFDLDLESFGVVGYPPSDCEYLAFINLAPTPLLLSYIEQLDRTNS